ncbi:AraC family transcriptional regulator [Sporosarcina sp. Te-1]|uniref:helix-turn-helix transcriptional regulator n=1 Tax=Sporosarcina sp. Te-1 TaxID=2818390 RepID=UPI001A9D9AC8|nr:AraC family transcriptional regulator [Sporosarcina sp. Te-1]QTD41848.1 helix-turn-helix domain-containing protein [Sporosarcina sp. Te-1]
MGEGMSRQFKGAHPATAGKKRNGIRYEQMVELYTAAPLTFTDVIKRKVTDTKSFQSFRTHPKASGLVFPLAGSAKFLIEGVVHNVVPGSVLHVGPDLEMQQIDPTDRTFEYAVIHFSLPVESLPQFPLYQEHFLFPVGDGMKVTNQVQHLMHNFLIPGRFALLQSKRLFLSILEEIIIASEKKELEKVENMDAILHYMNQCFSDGITVYDVAGHFGLDRRRLTALFKRQIGVSPNVFLTHLRIQQAKLLLQTTDFPITEIAEQVGYRDHFYFSRVFKKVTGLSPTIHRRHMG